MATGSLKDVQTQFDVISSRSKAIENDIKKLDGAKKDKDKKSATGNLLKQISQTIPLVQKLQERLTKAKAEIEGSAKTQDEEIKKPKKKEVSVEDSELTYELKAQLMKNVQVQNDRLKMELTLQEKVKELKLVNQQNSKLQHDCSLSHSNSLKLVQVFEKKAKEASAKLQSMQEELKKSQDITNRYRDLYESEHQKQRTQSPSKQPAKTEKEPVKMQDESIKDKKNVDESKRPEHTNSERKDLPNSQSMLGHGTSVNDVIRRNQSLVKDNNSLQQEVIQLRKDNNDLIKKVRATSSDRDTLFNQLNASDKTKQELSKRLQKEKTQKQQLQRSMTKQASDWIQRQKQMQQYEDEYRWSQVGHISNQGAEERSRSPYKSNN